MNKGIYFIGGSEPYLVDCQRIALVGKLSVKELNFLETDVFDTEVINFLNTFPMGDDRKVVYLTIEDLSELDVKVFHSYKKKPSPFGCLIVRFRKYDARKSFYKTLKEEGLLQLFDKESVAFKLSEFITSRAAKMGATFADDSVLNTFIERENYANQDSVTLYNILGDLKNLASLSSVITMEAVCSLIADNEKDNVFGIAKLIVNKDISGLRTQAVLCKGNEIATLSALLREYRISYKAKDFSLSEIGVSKNTFKGLAKEQLIDSMDIIIGSIDAVKSSTMPMSVVLEHTFLRLVHVASL